ncbi:MAG: acetolactate synthase small subunit [Phycisphaerae bacterium]|nr:acetolactate synthase small subunit [Phycisphaerae bacterium]
MKHTLSCLVKNQPGVLAKVSEAFASKGISIESLAVGETEDTNVSRATIVVTGDDRTVAEAERQCEGLEVVLELEDLASEEFFARELLLIKVRVRPGTIARIMQVSELFQARVVGLSDKTITLELAAEHRAIDGMLRMVVPFGIVSMARSGQIAVSARDNVAEEIEIEARTPPHTWPTGGPGSS